MSQPYEDGQANQAGCLNLLTNAVIVWNTVYIQAALDAIRREGYPVQEEDLAHLWPIRLAHMHRYGKYEFNVEAARMRAGLRPLRRFRKKKIPDYAGATGRIIMSHFGKRGSRSKRASTARIAALLRATPF